MVLPLICGHPVSFCLWCWVGPPSEGAEDPRYRMVTEGGSVPHAAELEPAHQSGRGRFAPKMVMENPRERLCLWEVPRRSVGILLRNYIVFGHPPNNNAHYKESSPVCAFLDPTAFNISTHANTHTCVLAGEQRNWVAKRKRDTTKKKKPWYTRRCFVAVGDPTTTTTTTTIT